MNRAELTQAIADSTELKKSQVEATLKALVQTVTGTVANGEEVKIPDFGTFAAKTKPARTARNPQTGAEMQIPEKRVPHFKPAKAFKDAVAE